MKFKNEAGESTLIVIISIVIGAVVMFVFPLMIVSGNNDKMEQLTANEIVKNFALAAKESGKITLEEYDSFVQKIQANHPYDIKVEVSRATENNSKKTGQVTVAIGDTEYITYYTTQVVGQIQDNGKIVLNEGDILFVSAENTDQTLFQLLKNAVYKVVGSDAASSASYRTMVTTNGN